jgi:hypothetical protein
MNKFLILTTLSLITFFACKPKTDVNTAAMKELSEDFKAFYSKFHEDSLFQFQHIAFPLKGLPANADQEVVAADDFFYQPNDWKKHNAIDFKTGEFIQTINQVTPNMVIEFILKADNSFGIERRFAKLSDGQWNLIYYTAPNRFSLQKADNK